MKKTGAPIQKTEQLKGFGMAFPHSHKTVFVLDHGPYFAMPCHQVEFDVARRGGPGFIPLAAISKSVWTCAVEAVAEYCRIVWDIFPNQDRLLRVVVASPECNEVREYILQVKSQDGIHIFNHSLLSVSTDRLPVAPVHLLVVCFFFLMQNHNSRDK